MKQLAPTKGNLTLAKSSLATAKAGYLLLEQKRNILINELLRQLDGVRSLRKELGRTFAAAYDALRRANVTLGSTTETLESIPFADGVSVRFRSVMGVDIPQVRLAEAEIPELPYSLSRSNIFFDEAYVSFGEAKELSASLAEVEISVYRLTEEIRKTEKRANALKNIVIPQYERTISHISDILEEREREEFIRMKMIKSKKGESA